MDDIFKGLRKRRDRHNTNVDNSKSPVSNRSKDHKKIIKNDHKGSKK